MTVPTRPCDAAAFGADEQPGRRSLAETLALLQVLWSRHTLTFLALVDLAHGVTSHLERTQLEHLFVRGLVVDDATIPDVVRHALALYVHGEGIHVRFDYRAGDPIPSWP